MPIATTPGNLAGKLARPSRAFATTHWSMVLQAADAGGDGGQAALEELCRIYWPALYGFARRRGLRPQDAEDLTQGFFADLLARGAIARADAARGRFRTFLLAAFQNYGSHQRARDGSQKRGGGCEIMSFDAIAELETGWGGLAGADETPEKLFDRQWARQLLDHAQAAVQREYTAAGKGAVFAELRGALWGDGGEIDYAASASRLGSTVGALKVALHRLRLRVGRQLRTEVAKTVADPGDIETEIRHLLAVFGA